MNTKLTAIAACLLGLMLTSQTTAAGFAVPPDGWASWEAAATEDTPDMCCWNGVKGDASSRIACNLDNQRGNLGNRDNAKTDAVRVYARMKGGKVERLRALSASCPVETATPFRDLGTVDADDSARWLTALSRSADSMIDKRSRESVITAIAMHRGDVAYNTLTSMAREGDAPDTRKTAIFWLATARGVAGAEVVTRAMFGDESADVREHAAFSITESRSPRMAQDLIRLGNTDKDTKVRSKAWFWLAQTGAPESEQAIGAAIRKDADDRVRDQAIFALSQLPDERSTRALIAIAEDKSLNAEQRKRAVFWLAESEKEGAAKYLERVLLGNAAR